MLIKVGKQKGNCYLIIKDGDYHNCITLNTESAKELLKQFQKNSKHLKNFINNDKSDS